MDTPIRVLLAGIGLNGHDDGLKLVARALRDAGMDVIYTGAHSSSEDVVVAAIQEDVDILGVSLLSGAPTALIRTIFGRLRDEGAGDMIVVAGGDIPADEVSALKALGVMDVMTQDTAPGPLIATLKALVVRRGPR